MENSIRIPRGEFLFACAYALLFFCAFYRTTTFTGWYSIQLVQNLCRVAAAVLIAGKCVLEERMPPKILACLTVLFGVSLLTYLCSRRGEFLDAMLLAAGSIHVEPRRVIRLYVCFALPFLTAAFACSQMGLIVDYTTVRYASELGGRGLRHGFGTVYATDFAAHVLYLYLAWHFLRRTKRRIGWWDWIATAGITVFLECFCNARLSELFLLGSLVLFTAVDRRWVTLKGRWLRRIVPLSLPASAAFTVWVTWAYDPFSRRWVTLDRVLFSNRLKIAHRVLQRHGCTLFGQYIAMQGQGYKVKGYNSAIGTTYLDSAYLQLVLLYGFAATVLVLVLYTVYARRTVEKRDAFMAMVLLVVALSSVMNQYLIAVAYNPFFLLAGGCAIGGRLQRRKEAACRKSC